MDELYERVEDIDPETVRRVRGAIRAGVIGRVAADRSEEEMDALVVALCNENAKHVWGDYEARRGEFVTEEEHGRMTREALQRLMPQLMLEYPNGVPERVLMEAVVKAVDERMRLQGFEN